MSDLGQAKETQSRKTFNRVRSGRQSPAQVKAQEATLKYGPYVLGGGVGGLTLKAVIGLLTGKTLLKGATKTGLKKAAEKFFGKKELKAAMNPTQAARRKALRKNNVDDAVPPKRASTTTPKTKTDVKKKDPPVNKKEAPVKKKEASKTNVKKKDDGENWTWEGKNMNKPGRGRSAPQVMKLKNKKPTKTDNVTPAVLTGLAAAGASGAVALANSDKVGTRNDLANFQANRRTDGQDGSGRTKRGKDKQTADDVLEVTSAKMAKEKKAKKVKRGDGVNRDDLSPPKNKAPTSNSSNKTTSNSSNKTTSETVSDTRKKETQLGTKKAKKADTKSETRRQKSQLNKPKGRAESVKDQILRQGKRKYGKFTVDSTDEGMSKFMGTKDEIRQQMEDEEMNFNKGGMAKYKKGGMAKAFGKGGMYKAPKKTYGMKYGGMTKKRGRA